METVILTFDIPSKVKGNIFEALLTEEKQQKEEQALTQQINKATYKKHREILEEIAKNLNEKLNVIGFNFDFMGDTEQLCNAVCPTIYLQVKCVSGYGFIGNGVALRIRPISEKFDRSRYVTYLGKYQLEYSCANFTATDYGTANFYQEKDVESFERTVFNTIKLYKGL